jgi:hypothetical protein
MLVELPEQGLKLIPLEAISLERLLELVVRVPQF